jgi:hypothetical protein
MSTVRRADVAAWMLAALEAPPPFPQRTVLFGSHRPGPAE